jgi:hypothetical protein
VVFVELLKAQSDFGHALLGGRISFVCSWWGLWMSESVETDLEARLPERAVGQTLTSLTSSPELRLGPLFLLVFAINIVVVVLAWLLVGLLNG